MPNPRSLRAARLAQAIAASGSYDADAVSRMFELADDEIKQLLPEAHVNGDATEPTHKTDLQSRALADRSSPEPIRDQKRAA